VQVFPSQYAFHKLEDQLRSRDVEEQKRNKLCAEENEAELDPRGMGDPYGPYQASAEGGDYGDGGGGAFGGSSRHLPLVANASPFQRADLYDGEFDERKSLRSDEFDGRSNYTSKRDESEVPGYGSESYAPSRNMFQGANGKGGHRALLKKEALEGEI